MEHILEQHSIKPYSKLYNQIYSYIEANKDNYSLLEHNISLNNIKNIKPFNLGIHNKITNCVSHKHDDNSGSIVMKETDIETVDTIKMLPLDNIDFNESIDFIKIDTEGSELFVLEGAKHTIHKYKPLIQVETITVLKSSLIITKKFMILCIHEL